MPIPVTITVFSDKSFTFEMKTPPASYFLKKAAKLESRLQGAGPRFRRLGHDGAGARDRESQDEGPERQRYRGGREADRRLGALHGHRGEAMSKIGKRTVKAREGIDPAKAYPLDEAVKLVKARATAKFDETIEVAMNLGVDPRHADQMVRGVVSLPNGTGPHARASRCSPRAPRPRKPSAPAPISSAPRIWSSRSARARSISTAASRRPT